MTNARAVETLGMSHGAAAGRLRKLVLFRQLKKYGDNVCVRCNKQIETADELSIEHIQPWEGRSAELFWNLDNVAFSHMKCNTPHVRRGGTGRRVIAPDGQSWCGSCEQFKSISDFSTDSSRWNGLNYDCKTCKNSRNALRDRSNAGLVQR